MSQPALLTGKTTHWHSVTTDRCIEATEADRYAGLTTLEATVRLDLYGPNLLSKPERWVRVRRLAGQFGDTLIWLLIVAAVVSGVLLDSWIDAGAIIGIVLINAAIGYWQESRAATTLADLKSLEAPGAKVIRDGSMDSVSAEAIVPGDLIVLESGDRVPADARVVEDHRLTLNEASLTGESMAVAKGPEPVSPDAPLGDRTSMVYADTSVTSGRGLAIAVATGPNTEVGRIAELMRDSRPKTPLEFELAQVGRRLAYVAAATAGLVLVVGLIRSFPIESMLLTAVALAVAAIPEGLPAIVTVSLAGGLQRMALQNSVVRRLPAVEALGAVDVICTDKTGTLTENELEVGDVIWPDGSSGISHLRTGSDEPTLLARCAALCNDAHHAGSYRAGDPTELALLEALDLTNIDIDRVRGLSPRLDESGFDGSRKRMSTLHATDTGYVLFVKGAPEVLIARSKTFEGPDGAHIMEGFDVSRLAQQADGLAAAGMRTLAFAYRLVNDRPADPTEAERDLCLLGLVGFKEKIRPEVAGSVENAASAGVRTVMVTGDHAQTAESVADAIGLPVGQTMEGRELSATSDEHLRDKIRSYRIFARVDPADKVKIIEAWQANGAKVAMTGDGVNDAPALKRADVGIAMGSGTDVARDASDMVLTDDNYATLVTAIAEGRRIFSNLRNVVHYLLSANTSEVLYVLAGFLLFGGYGEPLLAIQLLWINLMSDSFPAIALGMEKAGRNLMLDQPGAGRDLLSGKNIVALIGQGTILATAAVAATLAGRYLLELDLAGVQTMVFTTLVLAQLLHTLNVRVGSAARWDWPGRLLSGALIFSLSLHLVATYTPLGQRLLHVIPLDAAALVWSVGLALISVLIVRLFNRSGWVQDNLGDSS